MTKKILMVLMGFATLTVTYSCSKLEENVLDEASVVGLSDKQQAEGIIAPVYAKLEDIFLHTNYFALQEISTDEAILPYRGGTDWGDNGIYMQLHQHANISSDNNVKNTWNNIVTGISRSVSAINALATNPDPSAKLFSAEARGMRAYYNLLMLDLFGLAFVKDDASETSKILRGEAAIEYI
jgi:hypothetical protein